MIRVIWMYQIHKFKGFDQIQCKIILRLQKNTGKTNIRNNY